MKQFFRGLTAVSLLATSAFASSQDELDVLLDGFESDGFSPEMSESGESGGELSDDGPWSLDGYIDIEATYNLDAPQVPGVSVDRFGLSHLRTHLKPELTYRFNQKQILFGSLDSYYDAIFDIHDSGDYTKEYRKDGHYQLELGQLYYQHGFGKIDLTLGRQIRVWGEAENTRVVDVINPIDGREIGLVDLENLRLPVTAGYLNLYAGSWSLEMGSVIEAREDKIPVYGSDYSPLPVPIPDTDTPDIGTDPQFTLALRGRMSKFDIGFYMADLNRHRTVMDGDTGKMVLPDYQMGGVSFASVLGSWVLKSEAAYLSGLQQSSYSGERDRRDWMLGMEYYGTHNDTYVAEYVQRWYSKDDSQSSASPDKLEELALRYSQHYLREKLYFTAFAIMDSVDTLSMVSRLSLLYKPLDNISFEFGALIYESDDQSSYFKTLESNDRLYFRIRRDY